MVFDPFSEMAKDDHFGYGTFWVVLEEPLAVITSYSLSSLFVFMFLKQCIKDIDYDSVFFIVLSTYLIEFFGYSIAMAIVYFELVMIRDVLLFIPYVVVLAQSLYVVNRLYPSVSIDRNFARTSTLFVLIFISGLIHSLTYEYCVGIYK